WPMSLNLNPSYVGSHWDAVEEGAARGKRTAKRSDWRMVREVFVADTDEEVGGFGTLLVFCFDYSENPKAWQHSMELLAKEVMPRFKGLVPKQRILDWWKTPARCGRRSSRS